MEVIILALKVVNKSRQMIPLNIVKDGKEISATLLSNGEHSSIITEETTLTIKNLEERGLVAIREVEQSRNVQQKSTKK